jgi:UDP-N-acetylglucosamine 2-epimerase
MTAARVAFYQRTRSGRSRLRTQDIYNPFPEEVNRRLISVMATYHFAQTETARLALLAETCPAESIYVTGNTVIDALYWTVARPRHLNLDIPLSDDRLILVTAHRRESFGPDFESICHALRLIVERNPDVRMIYPVHLNPLYRSQSGVF